VDDPEANRDTIELKEDQPWEPYVVQVRAKNKLGSSKVTPEDIEGRTGQGVPSVVPTNFRYIYFCVCPDLNSPKKFLGLFKLGASIRKKIFNFFPNSKKHTPKRKNTILRHCFEQSSYNLKML
jgi:hypothetical protein